MSLSKQQRDALPASDFAVPSKRMLPMHDRAHLRMAWDMVSRTSNLTDEERSEARRRILDRARELGIDTSDWTKIKAMAFDAMSLDVPETADHPNKMPFSGILTRLDQPSDAAPHGSNGRRIVLSAEAAEKALPTLLGMAVDVTSDLSGHDAQAKIGIIEAAEIEGDAILISGFIYAADFPTEAATIKARKDALGFSFEAQRIEVADMAADPLVITDCVFTGAAILLKDKAAYTTTSLAASADKEFPMTADELKAILAEQMKPLADRLEKIEAEQDKRIEANKNVMDQVEPHAKALESAASGMEAAGIGCAADNGHVHVLRRMAGSMRAAAAMGRVPHVFRDHDWPMMASADANAVKEQVEAAVEAATKPLHDKLAAAETKFADLKAAAVRTSPAPERKTLSPAITTILAKAGVNLPDGDGKVPVAALDKALADAGIPTVKRLEVKTGLTHAGLL